MSKVNTHSTPEELAAELERIASLVRATSPRSPLHIQAEPIRAEGEDEVEAMVRCAEALRCDLCLEYRSVKDGSISERALLYPRIDTRNGRVYILGKNSEEDGEPRRLLLSNVHWCYLTRIAKREPRQAAAAAGNPVGTDEDDIALG